MSVSFFFHPEENSTAAATRRRDGPASGGVVVALPVLTQECAAVRFSLRLASRRPVTSGKRASVGSVLDLGVAAGGEFFDAVMDGGQFAIKMVGSAGPWDSYEVLIEVGDANLAIEIADDAGEVDEA